MGLELHQSVIGFAGDFLLPIENEREEPHAELFG